MWPQRSAFQFGSSGSQFTREAAPQASRTWMKVLPLEPRLMRKSLSR